MFVILIVSLFTARIVFNTLGIDDYGIYNVVGSIIVFFNFINAGLSGATTRYITAELAEGDAQSQRKIFSIGIQSHFIIALVVFIGGETIGLWLLNNVLNIPESRMYAANVVYQLSVISAILGIMQSPFSGAIIAHEKMSIYAYFSILDVAFKLIIIYLVQALQGDKLIIYALLIFVIGIINIAIYCIYCYRKFAMCHYIHCKDAKKLKAMFGYMGWSLFGQASYVLTNQGVTMLINVFYNVAVNAAMGVSNAVVKIVCGFVSNFQIAARPQITKYFVNKEYDELNKLTIRSSRLSGYLLLVFLIPICFEIKDFLSIWLGDYPQYSVEFCIITLICIYFESICGPLTMMITSDENIKTYQITVSLFYSTNFIFCWLFLSMGFVPYVVVIIRLFVDFLLVFLRLFLMKNKEYNFPIIEWLKSVVGKSLLIIAIPLALSYILMYINIDNIWIRLFFISGISFISVSVFIYLLGLNKNEKIFVINEIKKKLPLTSAS